MKVLLINGSPHGNGCVFTALSEVSDTLKKHGIDTEIFQLGSTPLRGCMGCGACAQLDSCAFREPVYDSILPKLKEANGYIFGSPVYYAGPSGNLCGFLDRLFYSAGKLMRGKPAAAVVNCRRGGASAAYDRLNKYFTINQMPVISSQYWNSTHGTTPEQVKQDLEGLQTMRTLANNMAFILNSIEKAALEPPAPEQIVRTNFIR